MEKVFCKDCKYYNEFDGCVVATSKQGSPYFTEYYINHKGKKTPKWKHKIEFEKLVEATQSKTGYDSYNIPCCNFNLKYNCKYYKRKWWKFWVKNEKIIN